MSDWIKCGERMPKSFEQVLFYSPYEPGCAVGYWTDRYWQPVGRPEGDSAGVEHWPPVIVTHWMPLPDPPKD